MTTLAVVGLLGLGLPPWGWGLAVLGLLVWWFIAAKLIANAITWTLAYALGVSREMRKVVRLEHRMEVAKQRVIDQFNAPPQRSREDHRDTKGPDTKRPSGTASEPSGFGVAEQIGSIWAMAKSGEGSSEDLAYAARELGQKIAEFARDGGTLSAVGHALGFLEAEERFGED